MPRSTAHLLMRFFSTLFLLAAFSSLRGFASSFGLADNEFGKTRDLTVMAASSSSSSSASAEHISMDTCSQDQSVDGDEEDELRANGDYKTSRKSSLIKFHATNTKRTPPMPMPQPSKSLDSFFGERENINLLFSADATLSEVDNPSNDLWEELHHCASLYQDYPAMTPPGANTPIRFVQLANPPMSFIGVTLHSTASVGIQFLPGIQNDEQKQQSNNRQPRGRSVLPELHFFLLSTNLEARGPTPLVWLFYKLIGKKQGEDGITSSTASRFQTSGFTRVWAEEQVSMTAAADDTQLQQKKGDKQMLVINNMALLESRLRIPSILLKLLPFSTEHLEQQGSASLQTAIDKDVVPALDRFQAAYTKWLSK